MLLSRGGAAADGPRAVRLGYCLNLHPSETLADVERALEDFVAPLAERLGGGRDFGVGMYLGEGPARALAQREILMDRAHRHERVSLLVSMGTWFPSLREVTGLVASM